MISKCWNLITEDVLKEFLKNFIISYKEGKIFSHSFFICLLELIEDPNIILDMNGNKESLLMLLCELSNYKIISILFKKKNLDVNYEDSNRRNALFYLKGGNDDKKIIDSLIKWKIQVAHKDIDGNTFLHYYAINNGNIQLIYKLIDIWNTNLLIKNNENISILDSISENVLFKKNYNQNIKMDLFNYEEINKLIQLIKNKLQIKPIESIPHKYIEVNMIPSSQNILKIPPISFNKSNNENEKNNDINIENNIYLTLKKNPSLIINNTRFEENKNNVSLSDKIENYKQISKNKKLFLDTLKKSENNLKESVKRLKANLEEKKKELSKKKNELKLVETLNKNSEKEFNNNLKKTVLRADGIQKEINKIKPEIGNYVIEVNNNNRYNIKNQLIINDQNKENKINNIFRQLTLDLNDYCSYIIKKNASLNNVYKKILEILKSLVNDCFDGNYILRVYGSRATGLYLPWSDIDCCLISLSNNYSINNISSDLNTLYDYIQSYKSYYDFIEEIKYIGNTYIPIIKIKTTKQYYNLMVDISMETSSNKGQECVEYIKQKIKDYQCLAPLTFALKTMFYYAKLNEPFHGGLSSYGIILLIIYFLNYFRNLGKDISINNIGKLFYYLLSFYKTPSNLKNKQLIINEGKYYDLLVSENQLFIVDPLNPYNNVANNARKLNKIILSFSLSMKTILERCDCGCHFQYEFSIQEEHCNHNLLKRIFRVLKDIDIYYDL